jgi:opacity protein-like surface antigen
MNRFLLLFALLFALASAAHAAGSAQELAPGDDFSGMYTFLEEGEFVQLSPEEKGVLTGYVSRFGLLPSDKGAVIDQFIKKGSWSGAKIDFTTEVVHGVWYEFRGTVERGMAKTPNKEGYRVIRGVLTEYQTDAEKKPSARTREVVFKSFPHDAGAEPPDRN